MLERAQRRFASCWRLAPIIALAASPAWATLQQPAPAEQPPAPAAPATEAPPTGKPLQALIIDVQGDTSRWRPSADEPWRPAKLDDLLDPGVEIEVGARSQLGLRVGKNATLIISRMTRLYLPEIYEDSGTLKTTVAVVRGKAEFKVDKVGLSNDFQVATPTTTLAVKGTEGTIGYGAFNGTEVTGASTNEPRAIELRYFGTRASTISGAGRSSESKPSQVLNALNDTVGAPNLGTDEAGGGDTTAVIGFVPDQTANNAQTTSNAMATLQMTQSVSGGSTGSGGTPEEVPSPPPNPPSGGTPGSGNPGAGSGGGGSGSGGPGGGGPGHTHGHSGGSDRPLTPPPSGGGTQNPHGNTNNATPAPPVIKHDTLNTVRPTTVGPGAGPKGANPARPVGGVSAGDKRAG